ncbi:hypothetical protein [Streptomyces sp. NPDC001089]
MSKHPVSPTRGWMADLTQRELQGLVGAMVHVFWNLKATTGLLLSVEDGTATIFRDDTREPLEYLATGTRYERVPGTPMRPALAHALNYQRQWDKQAETLTDDEGNALDTYDYDKAKGEWEQGLDAVYGALVQEAAGLLFVPAVPTQGATR